MAVGKSIAAIHQRTRTSALDLLVFSGAADRSVALSYEAGGRTVEVVVASILDSTFAEGNVV